jgi:hypothetical protein
MTYNGKSVRKNAKKGFVDKRMIAINHPLY